MRTEEEIRQQIDGLKAEIANIDKKQTISLLDHIQKRDLMTRIRALRWCLK